MGPGAHQNSRTYRSRGAQGPAATLLDRVQRAAGRLRPDHLPAGLAILLAMLIGHSMPEDRRRPLAMKAWALVAGLTFWWTLHPASASAIDFYEIQIYTTDTTPKGQLTLELHSNSVTTATGQLAHETINPYQIHETLEATYGVFEHLEVGQYFCTAKLNNGNYEYAGSRSKMHFGIAQTDRWPIALGGNIELDYMRFAAEDNPLTLELRPIL